MLFSPMCICTPPFLPLYVLCRLKTPQEYSAYRPRCRAHSDFSSLGSRRYCIPNKRSALPTTTPAPIRKRPRRWMSPLSNSKNSVPPPIIGSRTKKTAHRSDRASLVDSAPIGRLERPTSFKLVPSRRGTSRVTPVLNRESGFAYTCQRRISHLFLAAEYRELRPKIPPDRT